MKKFWMLFTVVVLATCMGAGCVGEAEKGVKTYTIPEQVINIGVNEKFVIDLACADKAESLKWEIKYDATMLEFVDGGFKLGGERPSEAAGTKWFKFKALKIGKTEITLVYVQWFINDAGEAYQIIGLTEFLEKQLDQNVLTVNIK